MKTYTTYWNGDATGSEYSLEIIHAKSEENEIQVFY